MSEWTATTVGDLVKGGIVDRPLDGNHGAFHPKGADFVAEGIPFIMASDLVDGGVDIRSCKFISREQAGSLRKGFARSGDVLLSHKATIGRTAIVGALQTEFIVLTPQVTYYRILDSDSLNNRYLKYYFDSPPFQSIFAAWAGSGSTRAYLGINGQLKLPIEYPPIDEQRAIAGVLGALDDKIEQNRRTARVLERLARAIFRAWFIDFEPVKAKAAGATAFPSMPQDVFDTLPIEFEDSELGPIPKGWSTGTIADACKLSKDQVRPSEHPEEVFEHFSIPAFDAGNEPVLEPGEEIKSSKFIVLNPCVMISKLNPRIPRVWLPDVSAERRGIASTEFLVLVPKAGWSCSYIYSQMIQTSFLEGLAQRASGTSNSHQRVKPADFMQTTIISPPARIREAFNSIGAPMMNLVQQRRDESRNLAELRDYLLPKLLSGQLRVNPAESAIVEVA